MTVPIFGISSFVRCNRTISSRSVRPPPPLISRSLVKPPIQCVKVDLENKDVVKQIDEFREVPRTTAEECYRLILVGDQGFHLVYMPDVVFVYRKAGDALHRFTSLRITLISQLTDTIEGMVAASLQFFAHRSFAGAGNAFNQIVSNAHWLDDNNQCEKR